MPYPKVNPWSNKLENPTTVVVRMEEEQLDFINELKKKKGWSIAKTICHMIDFYSVAYKAEEAERNEK